MNRSGLCAVVVLTLLGAACGGGRTDAPPRAQAAGDAPATTLPAPGRGTAFGVKECDDYFAGYTECVSTKVPAPVRAAMVAALDQSKAQWKAAAATPEGRAGLAEACLRAKEAARASMQAYGCRW
jgi:hypothetical protein